MNPHRHHWLIYPAALLVALAGFVFFQLALPYHQFLKEQAQLFLLTPDYFVSYLSKPAWLACYTADFVTQFFYFRFGGPLLLGVVLGTEYLLAAKLLNRLVPGTPAALAASIPVAADLVLNAGTANYLASAIASAGLFSVLLIHLKAGKYLRLPLLLLVSATGYWLAGSLFILYPLFFVLVKSETTRIEQRVAAVALLIGLTLVPMLRLHFLLTPRQAWLYPVDGWAGLLPVAGVTIALTAARVLSVLSAKRWPLPVLAALPVLIAGFGLQQTIRPELEKILSLDCEYYFGHPDNVLKLADKYQLRNRISAYYVNLALAGKNELPDRLLEYYQPAANGLLIPVRSGSDWLTTLFSNEGYFATGDLALAQHAAMLANTFSPKQRSSRMLKRLAEINLINGDEPAAARFLGLLQQTLFYRRWAEKRMPGNQSEAVKNWIERQQAKLPVGDQTTKPADFYRSLAFVAAENRDNQTARDYVLCLSLLSKNLNQFGALLEQYRNRLPAMLPKVYAEARLILLSRENHTPEELFRMGIPPQILADFSTYTQLAAQGNNGDELQRRFGTTYWFYFHFAKQKEE